MNRITKEIIQEAREYIAGLMTGDLGDKLVFHTPEHAKYVAESAEYIGRGCGLNEDDLNTVIFCAWFHDAGYTKDPENHEAESAKLATGFLEAKSVDKEIIDQVAKSILSTGVPQTPDDMISKVLCDADLRHLADDSYFELIDNLRKEKMVLEDRKLSKRKFHRISEKFFLDHHYHTDFARNEFEEKKARNLELIKKERYMLEQKKESQMLEKGKKKSKNYSRGVESMFRLTARNQINLSSIADNKSNILISVNAIMMSITMTVLVTRFEEVPHIIIPTLIFLLFSLVTIVFAILSTRPNISSGKFTREDIEKSKVNLLFFGNFYNMDLEEYEWAVGELMKNDEDLYGTMIKDQYSLGKVLAKKYKLLRIAYNVFMFGIIISVLAFVLAFINI